MVVEAAAGQGGGGLETFRTSNDKMGNQSEEEEKKNGTHFISCYCVPEAPGGESDNLSSRCRTRGGY